MLDKSQIQKITIEFYSHFCDTDLEKFLPGIQFICTPEREKIIKGFGCPYGIYVLVRENQAVIAFSPKYQEFMDDLKVLSEKEILSAIRGKYAMKEMKLFIFDEEKVEEFGEARVLNLSDYALFETFFCTANPEADPEGWLEDYFTEKVKKGYFTGYFKENQLVSVCDAPDMPFMEGRIQHTGITTLSRERGKGYGKCTAALATHNLLAKGICPQWECDVNNVASCKLAKSIGYKEFGTAYILEEWD